jgi:hypothetical protein
MKKLLTIVLILIGSCFILSSCGNVQPSAEKQQTEATAKILNEMNNQIGMPNIKEFYEKKLAKEIFELRDNSKLICYAYTQNMNGKFVYVGRCMGYGLPYSVQYTNPQQVKREYLSGSSTDWEVVTLPQADPNGLYMPDGLSATWIMLINEETSKREIMYCEQNVVVTQSKMPKRLLEEWSVPKNY